MGYRAPFIIIMRIIFSLLFVFSLNLQAKDFDRDEIESFTPIEISAIFDSSNSISVDGLLDLVEKDEKVKICINDYIKKQSRSYMRIAQNNLYDLIHNFDKIISQVYGEKSKDDGISHDEKLAILAKTQCEAYYIIGVLK